MKQFYKLSLFFLTALFLIRSPLASSLWLDESVSLWVVRGDFSDVWHRAILFERKSPLYFWLLWIVRRIFGESELILRLPSVIWTGIGLIFVRRIVRKLSLEPTVATLAALLMLCAEDVQRAAVSARPYGLAFMLALASIYFLLCLLERFSLGAAVLYLITTLLAFYAHYLFVSFLVVHFLMFMIGRLGIKKVSVLFSLLLVGMLPGLLHLRATSVIGSEVTFAKFPSLIDFFGGMLPIHLAVVCGVGLLLSLIWGGSFSKVKLGRREFYLLLVWIVSPPIVLLAGSAILGTSIWISRYWVWQVPALSILLAAVLEGIRVKKGGLPIAVVIVGLLAFRLVTQRWSIENWRDVAALASQEPNTPIVLFPGLVEAESRYATVDAEEQAYLRVPLEAYAVPNKVAVIGLTEPDQEVLANFKTPSILIGISATRRNQLSPKRFVDLLKQNGYNLDPLLTDSVVYAYRVQRQ